MVDIDNGVPLGRVQMTAGVVRAVEVMGEALAQFVGESLAQHSFGLWGDIDAEDRARNDRALKVGERVMSVWNLPKPLGRNERGDTALWIMTECDRSVTTALWPSEY